MSVVGSAAITGQKSFKAALPGLLFLTTLFLLNFISRIIFAPLLPVIEREFGLSHAGSGSFFLFISAGYFLSILGSGFISSSISHRKTIAVSSIASGCMLFVISLSQSLVSMRISLFFLGICAGIYLPSGLATITRSVAPGYLARGIAIHEVAPNLGFFLAPLLAGFLLTWLSWSQTLAVIGTLLIFCGFGYLLIRTGDSGYGTRPDYSAWSAILLSYQFWFMVTFFSCAIFSTLGLYAMLPLYLVAEKNIDYLAANNLVAFSRASSVIMPLVAGWAGDRFGNYTLITFVLITGGLLTASIGLLSGNMLMLFIVVQPLIAVCFFPSGFVLLSRIGGSDYGGVALSLCIPLAFLIGAGILPTLIGFAGDHHSLGLGIVCAGLLIVGSGILAFRFRFINQTK